MSKIWDNLMMIDELEKGKLFTAALLEVGGIRYPKSGNVLILSGGPGSGKGRQLKTLIGLEGKVLDIDEIQTLMIKSRHFQERLLDEFGIDVKKGSLKDPQFVSELHSAVTKMGFDYRRYEELKYIADIEERKPNLIFDVTLSSIIQFRKICETVKDLHYDLKKIHLVWVLNTLEVSLQQNAQRERVLPEDLVELIHQGVSVTMRKICTMGAKLTKYLDGDIWVSFNQVDVDVKGTPGNTGKGFHYTKANMFKIKSAGGPIKFPKAEGVELTKKIFEYTKDTDWKFMDVE